MSVDSASVFPLLIIGLVYEVTLIALRGQTVGKMLLGIRVASIDDGSIPGWEKAAKRWAVPNIASLIPRAGGLISLLVYLSLLWGPNHQGWHDMGGQDGRRQVTANNLDYSSMPRQDGGALFDI